MLVMLIALRITRQQGGYSPNCQLSACHTLTSALTPFPYGLGSQTWYGTLRKVRLYLLYSYCITTKKCCQYLFKIKF